MAAIWTPEELEAMRLADEEIDREFERAYVADQVQKEMDSYLDELAVLELMDNRARKRRKYQKKYSAAYREAHREEIAAYKAAYREKTRDAYNAYMREYMREYRKGIRRKGYKVTKSLEAACQ